MSAIDATFTWVRNPTNLNSLQTTYVSKRGSDVSGDGTAQNPYASLAKATAMATAKTNIMLDDGEWNEDRTNNSRYFYWWGNGKTTLAYPITGLSRDEYHFLILDRWRMRSNYQTVQAQAYDSVIKEANYVLDFGDCATLLINRCVVVNSVLARDGVNGDSNYSILINSSFSSNRKKGIARNCIIINGTQGLLNSYNCNFTTSAIPTTAVNSINNATTGQTLADYFNHIHPNVLTNPSIATIDDWLKCDFTAKEGSKNIGAGEKGTTIGLNQGYTMYADNSANDMFSASNGAILKNIEWNSNLNGYTLVQKERICQGLQVTQSR